VRTSRRRARCPDLGKSAKIGRVVEWNGRLVRDDVAEEVARLKAQPGFDMDVGSGVVYLRYETISPAG